MVHSTRRFVAVLALVSAFSSAAAQQPDPLSEARQVIDQAFIAMFNPGEQDPAWNQGGADIEQALKAKPGHVVLEVDKDGDRTIWFYARSSAAFVPADWELVTEAGQIDAAENAEAPVEIAQVNEGYYSVSRTRYERVGDAFCNSAPLAAQLYKVKGAPQGDMSDQAAAFLFREILERSKTRTMCQRFELKDGVYGVRFFLKDGRALPYFNDKAGTSTIVPQRPTMEMLAKAAPPKQ